MASSSERRRELIRWSASGAGVIACYAGVIAGVLAWHPEPGIPAAAPLALAMIDLEPLPPPPQPPAPLPPEPPPPMVEPEPEPPPPEVKVEVAVPPPTRKPPPKIKPVATPPPPMPMPIPVAEPTPTPPMPAPQVAAVVRPSRDALALYLGQIVAHVERNLRYPGISRTRREEGISIVTLTLDSNGKVLGVALDQRSGFRALDEEAIAVIRRAEPFPVLPADLWGTPREFLLPIRFKLR